MIAFKLVNGVEVPLTDAEIVARQAEESAFAATLTDRATAQIKSIRKAAHARYAPAGVAGVYDENLKAARAVSASQGDTTSMRDGSTATQYCTALGANLGKTAAQFAAYIEGENARVAALAKQVEQEYLRLVYAWLPAQTDPVVIAAAVTAYQTYCDARKP